MPTKTSEYVINGYIRKINLNLEDNDPAITIYFCKLVGCYWHYEESWNRFWQPHTLYVKTKVGGPNAVTEVDPYDYDACNVTTIKINAIPDLNKFLDDLISISNNVEKFKAELHKELLTAQTSNANRPKPLTESTPVKTSEAALVVMHSSVLTSGKAKPQTTENNHTQAVLGCNFSH